MTKLTGLPRSSFYYSETHPKQDKHKEERELVQQIYHANKGQMGKVAPNLLQRDFSTTKSNENGLQMLAGQLIEPHFYVEKLHNYKKLNFHNENFKYLNDI